MGDSSKGADKRDLRPGNSGLPRVVAGYIRVSSRGQDYSSQRHAIEAAARARGELVHLWFADVATGRRVERPQLRRLRDAITAGRVHRIWVWRLDRLTRSGIVDAISCITEIRRCGATVASVADGFALDSDLMLAMIAWAAQQELLKLRENQDAARARMRLEGRPWGRPPLPDSLKDEIRRLGSQGKSPRQIAAELPCSKSSAWNVLRGIGR